MQLLRDINAAGTAVLMATHDLDIVKAMPDAHLVELQNGRVVYDSEEDAGPEAVA